jgi:hypothetical protein
MALERLDGLVGQPVAGLVVGLLPGEDLLPDDAALTARVVAMMDRFIETLRPTLVVIACNTASTLALPVLRARFSIPFVGTVPAIKPDVAIVHAQKADRDGNVLFEGIVGVQKEAVLSAKRSIVTVEEIVDEIVPPSPNAVMLPGWTVSAIAHVLGGAHPSYAHGYYKRDNAFYKSWDKIARDRDSFTAWIDEHVLRKGPEAFAHFAKRAA